jgi:putative membrane protein
MALERTLMAWMRTATALVGFGFTIVEFFQRFGSTASVRPALDPHVAPIFGISLIALGTVGLLVALIEYAAEIRHLWQPAFRPIAGTAELGRTSPAQLAAGALVLVGVWALASVIYRVAW